MKLVFKKKYLMLIAVLFVGIIGFVAINNIAKNESRLSTNNGLKQYNYVQVQEGDNAITGTTDVTFDAYFLQGNDNSAMADKYRGASIDVSSAGKLWIELRMLGNATFKDAYIEFANTNVNIEGALVKDTVFAETIVSNNITRIPLNEISTGTTKMFYLTVSPNLTYIVNSYYGTNKVTLKGTVEKDGVETQIEKEVEYEVNFYGDENSMKTDIIQGITTAPMVPYGSDETVTVTYNVKLREIKDLMLIKNVNFEAAISKLNGYDPVSVSVDSKSGFEYQYDSTTRMLTARREAVINNDRITKTAYAYKEPTTKSSNGTSYYSVDPSTGISKAGNGTYSDPNSINKSSYYNTNELTITVVYPNAASYKTGTATVILTAWHEGFNNDNILSSTVSSEKLSRSLIANYQCDDTKGTISTLFTTVKINKDTTPRDEQSSIDSTNLGNKYRGIDNGNVKYDIDITPYIGGYGTSYPIGTFEIYDLDTNYINNSISMKQYEKYYSVSLSTNAFTYLGQQGYVKVIDADTGEVLHIFEPDNASTTYVFNKDVRSIKLEFSDLDDAEALKKGINKELFTVKLTKEIDSDYVTNSIDYDEYKTWEYLQTNIRTDWTAGEYSSKTDTGNQADAYGRKVQRVSALFTEGLSRAELTVDTTETKNQLEVKIDTKEVTRLYKGYINGEFLIEIPDAILYYDVVEDTINYEKLEIDGHNILKIKMDNENAQRYQITFHLDIVPDVRVVNKTIDYKLYAYNANCHNYLSETVDIYDVNNNRDTTEKVGYAVSSMNIIAPSEVITAATLENYNEKQEITVSPMVAEVDPTRDNGDGKVKINVINNSGFAIKDVKVIGKIAFVGNKNQINNEDLNSEFNTQMTSAGIRVPDELVGNVTIYYSENENPSDDVNDASNGWVETPTDFANIKSYMIIVNGYELANQSNVTFEYNITMPTDTDNLLKKAYFTHAVYFNLSTESGLVAASVGSTKLGVTMVRKYDLNIDTFRKGTTKSVDAVKYEIEDEDGNIKTIAPNSTGLEAKGLYVGKIYKLRQKTISRNYEIDEEEKTFEIVNGANDVLEISSTGDIVTSYNNNILNVTIENYPKYTLVVKASDFDTNENISNAKIQIDGKGYQSGYNLITNVNGEVSFKNLYVGEMYYLYTESVPKHLKQNSSLYVKLAYDDQTGEANLVKRKYAQFSEPTPMQDSSSSSFSVTYTELQTERITNNSTSASERTRAYIVVDLEGMSNNYTIRYNSSGYLGHLDIYASERLVDSISDLTSSEKIISTEDTYIYNNFVLAGGKKYYIYIDQYSMDSSQTLAYINLSTSGSELVDAGLSFNIDNDINESFNDNLNTSYNVQPIVNLNVKYHAAPTTKLKITKKDSGTGEPLANAIYRLEGPDIIDGILLTTDENGVAEYDIYRDYDGDYYRIGLSRQSYSDYKLKEVSAPGGYSIDKKEYSFKLTENVVCPSYTSGITCTPATAKYSTVVSYSGDSLADATYDRDTNTFSVNVYDYPLVTIVKKDSDTGELLPNTMFAIYKVVKENGKETLSKAYDANGKEVGEEIEIDGNTYNVITTNAKGEINLNLEKGQYKLKEVQASSEKYDISKQTYYFGVGETVPYQAEGINYVDAYNLTHYAPELVITNPNYGDAARENVRNSPSRATLIDDETFILTNGYYIAMFDKNGNRLLKGQASYLTYQDATHTDYECITNIDMTFNYYDKDSVTYTGCLYYTGSSLSGATKLKDGSIIVREYMNIGFTVDGQWISYSVPFIWLNSDGTINSKYNVSYNFTSKKNITQADINGNKVNTLTQTDNPNQIYDGKLSINGYSNNSIDYRDFKDLSDGRIIALANTLDGGYLQKMIIYDANGNFVEERSILDDVKSIYSEATGSSNSFGYDVHLVIDDEDNILFTYKNSSIFSQTDLRLKYDKNLNIKYVKPVIYDESGFPQNRYYDIYHPVIEMKSNGGYYYYALEGDNTSTSSNNLYVYNPEDSFTANCTTYSNYSFNNYFVLEYDKDGKAVSAVNIARDGDDKFYPETNKYVVSASSGSFLNTQKFLVTPYEDGFLVATSYRANTSSWASFNGIDEVTLVSGEKINITGNYIIYKVNKNSRVEWLKQYNIEYDSSLSSDRVADHLYKLSDGKIMINFLRSGPVKSIQDLDGNYLYGSADNTQYADVVIFEPSAEVLASSPEKYSLDIKNEAKKFAITVNSDDGSTYSVKNSNGQEVFNGSGEYKVETVKYDNNSLNDIIITLKPNHALKSVTLNGKDFTYQVNSDGTITLDKIPSITEDKVINIETVENVYSVTVHHYLENTTDRIASDEILSGAGTETYEAKPVVSNLYSLITDQDGNYIVPANASLRFENATGDVIFYYKENEVELNVNYYVENTSDELKPTLRQRKLLGSRYSTEPAEIEFYNLTGVAGEENGILNQNLTTVSYFYQQVNESTITVKHLDINTGAEVAPTETLTVAKDAQYTTNVSTNIPANYEYVSRTSNAIDTATHENIEVIYYYRVTPFNVSVDKKIDRIRINGKDITISDSKLAKIEPNKGDEVIIYYEITLKNDGNIKAEFRVVEQDVDNFVIYDLGNFVEENGEYVLKETLEPGEEKTYKIGYKWEAGHYGKSKNKVEVTDVKNARGFSEPDALDNISETVVIINVPTGLKLKFTFVILAGIIVNGGLIMLFIKRGIRR